MRAAVLTAPGEIKIQERKKPALKNSRDVLLRIEAAGICGSDIHYYRRGGISGRKVEYPFIIGHECTAEVEETGEKVTRVKSGDRIAVDPALSCGKCGQCRAGRPHTCRNLRFLGCPGEREGCLQEYIIMPETNCFVLPHHLDPGAAVLIEPLSIGIYAVGLWGNDSRDVSAAVLGSGPIGLCTLIALKESGISKIYMTDKIDDRVKAARNLGAFWSGNPEKEDTVREIIYEEKEGLDAVFECCGDQNALNQAVSLLKPGGSLIIIGIPETERIVFDPHRLRRKEISISNVRRQNKSIPLAIEQIKKSGFPEKSLATHIFPLKETDKAFKLSSEYRDGVIKAVIRMQNRNFQR